ncbi:NADPH-dependent F420 reductase [Jannaschia sp. 2305UL9-9]|uniref:NADPH-dependent F420 reductase n=1 Tax=Jannaschia sp. 2305UL9-9 TaxID=3121638 RepID=UPI00352889A1
MNVAILGAGNVGTGLARALSTTRHGVVLAGRDPAKARKAADAAGSETHPVQSASLSDAIAQAEIVILALPFDAAEDLAKDHGFAGKIVIDPTNPVKDDFSGLALGFDTSAAERIAAAAPEARVVKGFNTLFAQVYENGPDMGGTPVPVFLASDDDAAKQAAMRIAGDAGFDAVDSGPLSNARYLEPLAYLNIQFGYMLGRGTQIAPAWLSR